MSEAQAASLLMALHFTQMDFRADVLARCASVMLKAAAPIPLDELHAVIEARGRKEGNYNGGLVILPTPNQQTFDVCMLIKGNY